MNLLNNTLSSTISASQREGVPGRRVVLVAVRDLLLLAKDKPTKRALVALDFIKA